MEITFKRERLQKRTSIRITEGQDAFIAEVAQKNNVPYAEVARTFLQAGINSYKPRNK